MSDTKHHHDHKSDDVGCLEAIEWLYAWLDGELDPASVNLLEKHLAHCQSCYTRREMEQALTARIRESGKEASSAQFRERLDKLLEDL